MKEVLKKDVVVKKVARKSVVRAVKAEPVKPPTKLALKKKPVSKRVTLEKKSTKKVSKKAIKSPFTFEEPVSVNKETVFVPSTASLRLLEKVELYRLWYRNNLPGKVAKIAQVSGYTFIFLGTLLASASYLSSHNSVEYSAAVVCTEEVCSEIADENLPPSAPLVTFKYSPPQILTNSADVIIQVQNTEDFKLYIKDLVSGTVTELTYQEALPGGEFRYLVSPQGLAQNAYSLAAEVETPDATYKFAGPLFTVETEEEEVQVTPDTIVELELATSSETLVTELEEEVVVDEVVTFDEVAVTQEDVETSEFETETEQEAEVVAEETLTDDTELESPLDLEVTESQSPITATLGGLQSTRYLKVDTGTLLPLSVAIYSEVASAKQSIYLGLATLVQGEWIFSLSALQLPSVNHLLYASFEVDGSTYRSSGVLYNPTYTSSIAAPVGGASAILVQKIELVLVEAGIEYANRNAYFSTLSSSSQPLFEESYELQFADAELLDTLNNYMELEQASLDNLLARYAHVAQVGKKYLLTLASNELTLRSQNIARSIAFEKGDRTVIPTLQTILAHRQSTLTELITKNETRLNQDSNSLTARDADFDGISDYDEIVSYATNADNPDSDFDGVTDAVEILTGTNPTEVDVSVIVEAGAAAEDILYDEVVSILEVAPLVVRSLETGKDSVHALVFGKSIPDSYVQILSASLGTVGYIKTNNDGDFSYTLEKDIADGRHEVVAVITDGFGEIVASSKPQAFIKTQNAFAAAAVGSQNVVFGTDNGKFALPFSTITTALGVVALGLVLLLLTNALRSRPKPLQKSAA